MDLFFFFISAIMVLISKSSFFFCSMNVPLKKKEKDFLGGPLVKTSPSNVGNVGLIPGQRAKIPHVSQPETQNMEWKQYGNKFKRLQKIIMTSSRLITFRG